MLRLGRGLQMLRLGKRAMPMLRLGRGIEESYSPEEIRIIINQNRILRGVGHLEVNDGTDIFLDGVPCL
jgi:hypothetical protein